MLSKDMNYNKLANMEILDVLFAEKFDDDQSKFMIGRQVQLAIGCCVLLFIIGLICKSTFDPKIRKTDRLQHNTNVNVLLRVLFRRNVHRTVASNFMDSWL